MNLPQALQELTDNIAYVMGCAPDNFTVREWLPGGRETLQSAYSRLWTDFEVVAKAIGETPEIVESRGGIQESFTIYETGNMKDGFLKLQEVYHILTGIEERLAAKTAEIADGHD